LIPYPIVLHGEFEVPHPCSSTDDSLRTWISPERGFGSQLANVDFSVQLSPPFVHFTTLSSLLLENEDTISSLSKNSIQSLLIHISFPVLAVLFVKSPNLMAIVAPVE
jgi:hypothetical protein